QLRGPHQKHRCLQLPGQKQQSPPPRRPRARPQRARSVRRLSSHSRALRALPHQRVQLPSRLLRRRFPRLQFRPLLRLRVLHRTLFSL
ncbi:hypothetical protein AAVH_35269, partial [Aphelenchoides avenae]